MSSRQAGSREGTSVTNWTAMTDATKEDWLEIGRQLKQHAQSLPDRIMAHMALLAGDYGGFPVDRLSHCLQTATRAYRDGRDQEYVVCALVHDIGDILGPVCHAELAAQILEPYVSEKNHWIVKHHGIFQGHYFHHHLGFDNKAREQFADHPYYQDCIDFCHLYDQNSFDRDYESEDLEFFRPMVEAVFSENKKTYLKKRG